MAEPYKARIALLMAIRDQADGLHHALSTLFSQSHSNFTLTLIDDGSQDHTPEVLARFADPRLTVIATRPQGLIPSLNLAMQKAKPAAFYGVVYASCFYSFHYLLAMLRFLQRHPKASGVFCCYCEGYAQHTGAIFQEPHYDNNELLVRNGLGPGILFRGESFRQAGGLFLSERKGIVETWQRMSAFGPFEKYSDALLRQTPARYEQPPMVKLDPEKDLYPHLKLRIQLLPGDTVDGAWLSQLKNAGHDLIATDQLKERPQLVLCSSPALLAEAFHQACQSYSQVMLLINDVEAAQSLIDQPQLRFILASCTIVTRTLKVAQMLKPHGHQAIVYLHGMTPRETNRLLTRVPMVLYKYRMVVLVRTFGSPVGLQKTLEAIRSLNRPPEFGDLLIYCVDQHPELIKWLRTQPYTWFGATQPAYYSELLFLLRQLKASHVLCLDAGVIPAVDYFSRLWPLLTDPTVGMAAGHINGAFGSQNLPLRVANPTQLGQLWPRYQPAHPFDVVDRLSDSAFLIRKQVLEWALEAYPDTLPFGDETLFSRLLVRAGFRLMLSRQTAAFNLVQTL